MKSKVAAVALCERFPIKECLFYLPAAWAIQSLLLNYKCLPLSHPSDSSLYWLLGVVFVSGTVWNIYHFVSQQIFYSYHSRFTSSRWRVRFPRTSQYIFFYEMYRFVSKAKFTKFLTAIENNIFSSLSSLQGQLLKTSPQSISGKKEQFGSSFNN